MTSLQRPLAYRQYLKNTDYYGCCFQITRVHTHYDNLRVARNAPPEIIRAAYKALSQKFHPDLNPGDPDAVRKMAIINASYEVLSDANRRKAHDRWIAESEPNLQFVQDRGNSRKSIEEGKTASKASTPALNRFLAGLFRIVWEILLAIGLRFASIAIVLGAIYGIATLVQVNDTSKKSNVGYSSQPVYRRPFTDPNGDSWPKRSAYLRGALVLNTTGRSSITVDNTQRGSDAHVKIFFINGNSAVPVREFYLAANSQFVTKNLTAGLYDVRYRDLDTGMLSKSEMFVLQETFDGEYVNWSDMKLTLYKVSNGNTHHLPISENEF